jgi:topoisomerase-4 subunit A
MRQLRLDPGQAFKKSARVVGDVIGNSIRTAISRSTTAGAARAAIRAAYPLVDGQAISETSTAITPLRCDTQVAAHQVARLLLDGIDENAVDFRPTYDGSESEPVVLPGAFPNLLANGSQGIAVGMATSIPPHNAAELCDAALFLIDNPNARAKTLLKYVPGPDFPTGGLIVDPREVIAEAYTTGRGSFRVRARWHKEETGRGTYLIVVTEIPWLVQKTRLIERMVHSSHVNGIRPAFHHPASVLPFVHGQVRSFWPLPIAFWHSPM